MNEVLKRVEKDRNEFIEVLNQSEITQDESDALLGLFDNVIQTFKVAKAEGKI